jgi:hypothetical protein
MANVDLSREIAAFEHLSAEVREKNKGRWVVIEGGEIRGFYEEFSDAAESVEQDLGRKSILIRQLRLDEPYFPFVQPLPE